MGGSCLRREFLLRDGQFHQKKFAKCYPIRANEPFNELLLSSVEFCLLILPRARMLDKMSVMGSLSESASRGAWISKPCMSLMIWLEPCPIAYRALVGENTITWASVEGFSTPWEKFVKYRLSKVSGPSTHSMLSPKRDFLSFLPRALMSKETLGIVHKVGAFYPPRKYHMYAFVKKRSNSLGEKSKNVI